MSKAEKISEAIGELDEKIVTEADNKRGKKAFSKRLFIPAATAAACALVLFGTLILTQSRNTIVHAETLAQADYPKTAQYPNENLIFSLGGGFSDDLWEKYYTPWSEDRKARRTAAEALNTDTLNEFYKSTTNTFLSDSESENTIYSPINLYIALSVLAETTDSETCAEILDLLKVSDIESLRTQTTNLWNSSYRNDGATVSILANSLWLDQGINYNEQTVKKIAEQYYTSIYRGDLTSEKMEKALHEWLNQQTDGLLSDSVEDIKFPDDPVSAICSTISFHAKWDDKFNKEKNDRKIFHNTTGDKETEFMNTTMEYGPYYWNEDYAAVQLHFEDSGSMWLILPDEDKTIEQILEKGQYLDMVTSPNEWNEQVNIKVNLSVPKFDVSSDLDLKEDLKKLGVENVFDIKNADFSALTEDKQVYLSGVQHSARVKIDEEGVTAVAFTAMATAGAALPPEDEVDFVIDREFLFVIMSDTYQPLFIGDVGVVE